MTRYLTLLFLLFGSLTWAGEDDVITFKIQGMEGKDAIIAYHYGNKKLVHDTVHFSNEGIAKYINYPSATRGIYLLAFPSMNNQYFEFIMHEGSFSLQSDTSNFVKNMTVKGSLENQVFYDDVQFLTAQGPKMTSFQQQLGQLEAGSPQYEKVKKEMEAIDKAVRDKKEEVIRENPDLFYSKVLRMMQETDIPEAPVLDNGRPDSSFAYRYVRKHYFDGVDFSDSAVLRTPVFHRKVMQFINDMTIPNIDSLISSIDLVLDKAWANREVFQYCLSTLLNKYASSDIMGHEGVYVHLLGDYYLKEKAWWVSEDQIEKFRERYHILSFTQIGKTAPEIIIEDIQGNKRSLHEFTVTKEFTVLVFWNSSCGHCKTTMPELGHMYEDTLRAANIGVFAITTELETEEWKEFIQEHELPADWIHCIDPEGRNPCRAIYDVKSTPLVLIIDKEKKIRAKRVAVEDIPRIIRLL